jgi:hypothetical protein
MPPPTFPASHPTLPTPTPSDSATAGLKPYVWRLTVDKKLAIVFKAIDKDVNWTFSEFLYYAFRMQTKNSDTKKLRRTRQHAAIVSRFLAGRDKYCVSQILAS